MNDTISDFRLPTPGSRPRTAGSRTVHAADERAARVVQRRLNRLVWLVPSAAAGMLAGVVVSTLATIGVMLTVAGIIDALLSAPRSTPWALAPAFVWLTVFVAVRALGAGLVERCGVRLSIRIRGHVRRHMVASLLNRRPIEAQAVDVPDVALAHSDERVGESVADATDGVEKLDAYYRAYLPPLVAAVVTPVAIIVAIAVIDPTSAAILVVTTPLMAVFLWLVGAQTEARTRAQWQTLRRLSGQFLETLRGLTAMIMAGRAAEAVARLDASGETYRVATMRVLRVAFLSGFVLELSATISTALVAVGVGVRLIEGWTTFGPALSVLLLTPEVFAPLRLLGQRRHAGMEASAAAERLVSAPSPRLRGAFAEASAPDVALAKSGEGWGEGSPSMSCGMTIRFENVSFVYPEASRPALSSIDLEISPRSLTALVGPSGAGKSTLVNLLLRFIEPASGAIYADNRPIAAIGPREWRRAIALVPQRPRFPDGRVLDLLRAGRPDASLDDVREAATRAEIDRFIMALPDGYETRLGEMAARVSVGERQRLAIARALLRDAPLLILDEPSASLDPVTEAAIRRVLTDESRRRAVLVVAHRLRTVRAADRLVVLDRGRIVEIGRHDDLARRGGVYARLVGVADELAGATR